jgi:hypothetical protein
MLVPLVVVVMVMLVVMVMFMLMPVRRFALASARHALVRANLRASHHPSTLEPIASVCR